MKAWKKGLIIGIIWGLFIDICLFILWPPNIIWLLIGDIIGYILIRLTESTFNVIQMIFPLNEPLSVKENGWLFIPIWGGLVLATLGYLWDVVTVYQNHNKNGK